MMPDVEVTVEAVREALERWDAWGPMWAKDETWGAHDCAADLGCGYRLLVPDSPIKEP